MGTALVEGELWGAKAREWAELCEPVSRPAWPILFEKLGVGPGMRLLDMGCGAGGALQFARNLGAEVAGVDASAALLEIARERNPGAPLEIADLEEIPFEDASFDAVSGINSFQFAGDIPRALGEARRVCKPGGKVGLVFWGPKDQCESMATMMAVGALMPPPPTPQPPSISEPGVLEGYLAKAGLTQVERGDVAIPFLFPNAETACRGMMAAGIVVGMAQKLGEETVRRAILGSYAPFTQPNGSIRQMNRWIWITATST